MKLFVVTLLCLAPMLVYAQDSKCPKGRQTYGNLCISHEMVDYLVCIESSGGNRQELITELTQSGGSKASKDVGVSGGNSAIKGSAKVVLDDASERKEAQRLSVRWFPNGMDNCSKYLSRLNDDKNSKKYHRKVLKNQNSIKKDTVNIIKGQNEILKRMEFVDQSNYSYLSIRYPLGYCLFGVDSQNIIVPYTSALKEYAIDWNKAKMINNNSDMLFFRIPTITGGRSQGKIENLIAGTKKTRRLANHIMSLDDVEIYVETVDVSPAGTIGVIGFKPIPSNRGDKRPHIKL